MLKKLIFAILYNIFKKSSEILINVNICHKLYQGNQSVIERKSQRFSHNRSTVKNCSKKWYKNYSYVKLLNSSAVKIKFVL